MQPDAEVKAARATIYAQPYVAMTQEEAKAVASALVVAVRELPQGNANAVLAELLRVHCAAHRLPYNPEN